MNTRKERCPDDHSPTIMLSGFKRDALSFRADEIVAGRYRITGTLARGGYSAVYAASHHSTRQPVAIKMLSIQHSVDAMRKVVRRFWREAQITARMTSPYTVRIIDVGQVEDGPLFIAMERLRGRTLGSFLQGLFKQELVMSEIEAIGVALPVLRCLEEAHGLGLVHRDLKPNNIMLARVGSDDTIVKVLDFGVARVKDSSLTADGNTLGTPAYMSPEQFRAAKVDARSDLYSLGVMMFLAVCGRLPFQERNIHALGMQHINDPVPDPRQFGRTTLSSGFVDALMCVLRKDPAERYQSARTMRQALELVMGGAASGMSVAHLRLRPAGKALIEQSVSARDSQAFLSSSAPDDATVGINEIDATIGVEEMEADAFAEALNPDGAPRAAVEAPTRMDSSPAGPTIEAVNTAAVDAHTGEEVTGQEVTGEEGTTTDTVDVVVPVTARTTNGGSGFPVDGHTPAEAVEPLATDGHVANEREVVVAVQKGNGGPIVDDVDAGNTLEMFGHTPSVGRILMQETSESHRIREVLGDPSQRAEEDADTIAASHSKPVISQRPKMSLPRRSSSTRYVTTGDDDTNDGGTPTGTPTL